MRDRRWFGEVTRRVHRTVLGMLGRRDIRPCVAYAYVPRLAGSARRSVPVRRD
jgi:hypothetical protein